MSCRCGLSTAGDSPQKVKLWKTMSTTAAISVKVIDFALFFASRILPLTLHLNPTLFSRQECLLLFVSSNNCQVILDTPLLKPRQLSLRGIHMYLDT